MQCHTKNCVSCLFNPHTVVIRWKLDFSHHSWAKIGAYAQVYLDTTPHNFSNLPCAASALVLGPTANVWGTYMFYNLNTGWQLVASQFTVVPMPQDVIDWVHAIADVKNMQDNLILLMPRIMWIRVLTLKLVCT